MNRTRIPKVGKYYRVGDLPPFLMIKVLQVMDHDEYKVLVVVSDIPYMHMKKYIVPLGLEEPWFELTDSEVTLYFLEN